MRTAFFGGSFDPPHRGHLALATAAADAFHLDTILFTPVARQPLKLGVTPTPYPDRLAMVTAACTLDPRFAVSNLDAPRADFQPNYTVDTLDLLTRLMPQAELFALVGADAFLTLPRWRDPARLLTLAEWIVVTRPGFSLDLAGEVADALANLGLSPTLASRVHLLSTVHEEVSATQLRERLAAHDPCRDLLPAPVAVYIESHRLYRTDPPEKSSSAT